MTADVPAGRFVKDDGTRPIKDGTLMDVEEDVEQVGGKKDELSTLFGEDREIVFISLLPAKARKD